MGNARLDESHAGIKIARRTINNLRYEDTTLMAESEEEIKSLLMKVKEESGKAGLKLNIQKMKFIASSPISSVQSVMSDSATPLTATRQASLSITNSWNLLKFMSIELVRPSNHLILCCPCLLLPSIFPSIRVFSSESALRISWLEYWRSVVQMKPFILRTMISLGVAETEVSLYIYAAHWKKALYREMGFALGFRVHVMLAFTPP